MMPSWLNEHPVRTVIAVRAPNTPIGATDDQFEDLEQEIPPVLVLTLADKYENVHKWIAGVTDPTFDFKYLKFLALMR